MSVLLNVPEIPVHRRSWAGTLAWRERTLARVVQHARALLPVSAVAFVTTEPGEPPGWLAT